MDDPKSRRGLRRHHRERMIERARAVVGRWWKFDGGLTPDEVGRQAARLHDHLAACSCPMCGNRRRSCGERTRQEIRVARLPRRGGVGPVEESD